VFRRAPVIQVRFTLNEFVRPVSPEPDELDTEAIVEIPVWESDIAA
jgi:hypothetical protein